MDKYDEGTMPRTFNNKSLKALRMHTDHCIETLRIVLMCQSDVTPLLKKISPDNPEIAEADFNSHHRCRNFDDIVAWNEENGLNVFEVKDHPSLP
jgi:hypothetical protein